MSPAPSHPHQSAAPAVDPLWEQVAPLRPRLRAHVVVHTHRYRGEPWYVMEDRASNRHHRFDAAAHRVLGLMDGERSVAEIEQVLAAEHGDQAPSPPELVDLVVRLHAGELLSSSVPAGVEELFDRYDRLSSRRRRQQIMRPLSVRMPLVDPERFLARLLPAVRWLYSGWGLALWTVLVGSAGLLAASHWAELEAHWDTRGIAPTNLGLIWLIYPLVKGMHELGHAFAVKRWGGTVHEMGLILLVFTPVPYVDASAATGFAERRRRVAVSAAGVMVELALGALGLLAWLALEPGLARDAAFNVVLIGVVSTLLFNGNPLMRFDGYYVLADAIDCPNLASRSSQYLGYLAQRYLLGLDDARAPHRARGERGWLIVYGIAAAIYRTAVLLVVALFIAGKMFVLGVLLAAWVLLVNIALPIARHTRFILTSPRLAGRRAQAVSVTTAGAGALAAFVFLVPVATSTTAEGVVQVPDGAQLRADSDGFVSRVVASDGASIRAGGTVVTLTDPLLLPELRRLEWRVAELDRRHARAWLEDCSRAQAIAAERQVARSELEEARQRSSRLVVRAPTGGTVVMPRAADLEGRFVRQGDLLGHVAGLARASARVVVSQADVGLVRERTRSVQVRLASNPTDTLPSRIEREVPAATDELPSAALGSRGGGLIMVNGRDGTGTHALETIFAFDLSLPDPALGSLPGTRVYVRFEHEPEPIAHQLHRRLRQLFLSRFSV